MFEVPEGSLSLMTDYTRLINEGLEKKYPGESKEQLGERLLEELTPCFEYSAGYGCIDCLDPESSVSNSWVEDLIGEDHLVLDGLEEYAFCIHGVDDFLKEVERLEKPKTRKEFYENKIAA